MKRLLCCGAAAAVVLSYATPAAAEPGDYSGWQTFWNLFSPPKADRKVRSWERVGEYGLYSNPSGFNDGFSPGNYGNWQTIQLHPSTGAICGNGSPFKFFINRVASTRNTMFYFEGGGACWDYASCTGQAGIRGARNPDGIPDDYITSGDPSTGLVSPLVWRSHPYNDVKTQDWNIVYVPYCTGDVYSGNKVTVYEDPTGAGEPLVWHHNGARNVRAVTSWMRDNMPRPTQMLMTGCSAGGAGAMTNYHPMRRDMAPSYGYMINDSGPLFPTAQGGSNAANPSRPLHLQIKDRWGVDSVMGYLARDIAGISTSNYGSVNDAIASRYTGDRLGHTHFQLDQNYSAYSYERFYPEIQNAGSQSQREALITEKWQQDTGKLRSQLASYPNYGGYFPYFRDVNDSHCTTIIDIENGDIQELGLELEDFIDSVMDGNGAVLSATEQDTQADLNKPFNLIYSLVGFFI
ncbi:pectinacetylesterase family protein [Parvularcula maris]|uniref:Pectinacetylesterase family protein n=1 Tax=Parvularcula maris TaxID=2965077 RepID=A0A9X2L8E8_9PROT|nr:pectinacetylesterase family protein [Parvularcula maris]MCQ8185000.1 pectinacetylesterase family protein [Parvularcula maris]